MLEVPGSTPGQAPFYAFLEVQILQYNKNRKIKPKYKNEIIIKETVKHTGNKRKNFQLNYAGLWILYREWLSPAFLIANRLRGNSIIFFLSYRSFEMMPCNEIAFDGGDRQLNLEAGCFSFVVVELRKPEITTSNVTVVFAKTMEPPNFNRLIF